VGGPSSLGGNGYDDVDDYLDAAGLDPRVSFSDERLTAAGVDSPTSGRDPPGFYASSPSAARQRGIGSAAGGQVGGGGGPGGGPGGLRGRGRNAR